MVGGAHHEQRLEPGRCQVALAQFDTEDELVYPVTDIDQVPDSTVAPRGRTALLDTIGYFVTETGNQLSALPEEARPGHDTRTCGPVSL